MPHLNAYLLGAHLSVWLLPPTAATASPRLSCSAPHGDCRASRCCNASESNQPFACFRHVDVYYAKCQPERGTPCGAGQSWHCPGWEACAPPHEECSLSRCCEDAASFGCFENKTVDAANTWRAVCLPFSAVGSRPEKWKELLVFSQSDEPLGSNLFGDAEVNVTSDEFFYTHVSRDNAFCEGTDQNTCKRTWRDIGNAYLDWLNEGARGFMADTGMQPWEVVAVVALSLAVAMCALLCGVVHRRRMHAHVLRLEAELSHLKEKVKPSNAEDRVPLQHDPDASNQDS
ncbi:hypothetical protein AB1Y20_011249 [Prymnesium parvum]|uniref:Phospholipase B-like n=1 Tax=Prymnesium parvum TaxID=97485 RepID=A0AB34ILC1_PRYPA